MKHKNKNEIVVEFSDHELELIRDLKELFQESDDSEIIQQLFNSSIMEG